MTNDKPAPNARYSLTETLTLIGVLLAIASLVYIVTKDSFQQRYEVCAEKREEAESSKTELEQKYNHLLREKTKLTSNINELIQSQEIIKLTQDTASSASAAKTSNETQLLIPINDTGSVYKKVFISFKSAQYDTESSSYKYEFLLSTPGEEKGAVYSGIGPGLYVTFGGYGIRVLSVGSAMMRIAATEL